MVSTWQAFEARRAKNAEKEQRLAAQESATRPKRRRKEPNVPEKPRSMNASADGRRSPLNAIFMRPT
jgi:hypothetical protein